MARDFQSLMKDKVSSNDQCDGREMSSNVRAISLVMATVLQNALWD